MDENTLIAGAGLVVLFGIVVWIKMWMRGGGIDRLLAKKK